MSKPVQEVPVQQPATTTTSLTVRDLADETNAGRVFRKVLAGTATQRAEGLVLLRSEPVAALQILARGKHIGEGITSLGLTPRGEHEIIDVIIDRMVPKEAEALLHAHIDHVRLGEIIAGGGDLGSVVALYAPIDSVVQAMLSDIGDTTSISGNFLVTLESWAAKLIDRADYQSFLATEIRGQTIREWLILSVYFDSISIVTEDEQMLLDNERDPYDEEEEGDSPLSLADLEKLGIELTTEDNVWVREFAQTIEAPTVDDIEDAKRALIERMAERENSATITKSRADAETNARKLDL